MVTVLFIYYAVAPIWFSTSAKTLLETRKVVNAMLSYVDSILGAQSPNARARGGARTICV